MFLARSFVVFLLFHFFSAFAQGSASNDSGFLSSTGDTQIWGGVDYWKVNSGAKDFYDPLSGFQVNSRTYLYLPDTGNTWDTKNPHEWIRMYSTRTIDNTTFTLKARADQEQGLRVDEASVDYAISPELGLRAGIVDYKISWCQTYEKNSAWIREPDFFCSSNNSQEDAKDLTGGSPGLQTYVNFETGNYRTQAIAGIYNPLLLNYSPKEFSFLLLFGNSPDYYQVQKNRKIGLSINTINMITGTEYRLSFIRSNQLATPTYNDIYLPESNGQVVSNVLYFGYSTLVSESGILKITQTLSSTHLDAYYLSQDPNYTSIFTQPDHRSSTLLEFDQSLSENLKIAIAQSNFKIRASVYPLTTYFDPIQNFYLQNFSSQSVSLAYRINASSQITAQMSHSKLSTGYLIDEFPIYGSSGNYYGLRYTHFFEF